MSALRPRGGNDLTLWTVYRHQADYPGQYVARRFLVRQAQVYATGDVRVAGTLDAVRALLPPGLHPLGPSTSDEPHIVECWL